MKLAILQTFKRELCVSICTSVVFYIIFTLNEHYSKYYFKLNLILYTKKFRITHYCYTYIVTQCCLQLHHILHYRFCRYWKYVKVEKCYTGNRGTNENDRGV